MMWAVHNLSAPAIEINEAGTYTHDGEHRIVVGEPLFMADTREEAETWRAEHNGRPA